MSKVNEILTNQNFYLLFLETIRILRGKDIFCLNFVEILAKADRDVQTQKVRGFFMAFEDRTLVCKDCGKEFIFSAGEQEFYAEKGFENDPVRCRDCRDKRRRGRDGGEREPRQMYKVICAGCGKETEVPFEPKNDRPVYCRDCFNARRNG